MSITSEYLSAAEVLEVERKWTISPVSLTNRDMDRLFRTLHHWQEETSQLDYYKGAYDSANLTLERMAVEARTLSLIVQAARRLKQEYETANPRAIHYSDDGRLADSLHGA